MPESQVPQTPDEPPNNGEAMLSYGKAMAAYGVLAALCAFTLRGDALFIGLLIIAALALKTWLARARSRLE